MGLRRILVTFPVEVNTPPGWEQALMQHVSELCKHYEAVHPTRVMWPAGFGFMITRMPMTKEDEEDGIGMEFDHQTLHIDVSEREDYKVTENLPLRLEQLIKKVRSGVLNAKGDPIEPEDVVNMLHDAYALGFKGRQAAHWVAAMRAAVQQRRTRPGWFYLMAIMLKKLGGRVELTPYEACSIDKNVKIESVERDDGVNVFWIEEPEHEAGERQKAERKGGSDQASD